MQSTPSTAFLTIGSRGSPLALMQARLVRQQLARIHGVPLDDIVIKTIVTGGDTSQASNTSLSEIGGKGLFSKEIEEQLLDGSIDIGVHSTKDMATTLPDGLVMPIFLAREDVRDAFLSTNFANVEDLPQNAVIGTSSLRRRAQLLHYRPDLQMVEFRGNLGTRIEKLGKGIADATLLAAAGLKRLEQVEHIKSYLDPSQFPSAPAQGAIGIELRANDARTHDIILPLNHRTTHSEVTAERAMLKVIDGSCRTPIGVYSTRDGDQLSLKGQLISPDGTLIYDAQVTGDITNALALGTDLGFELLEKAGPDFFAMLQANS